jgi:hypothetical protein
MAPGAWTRKANEAPQVVTKRKTQRRRRELMGYLLFQWLGQLSKPEGGMSMKLGQGNP